MAMDIKKQTRRAPLRRRKSESVRPRAWPLGESEPVAAGSTRRSLRRHAVADSSATPKKRSLVGGVIVWIRYSPGHSTTPTQQALDTIAPSTYSFHR